MDTSDLGKQILINSISQRFKNNLGSLFEPINFQNFDLIMSNVAQMPIDRISQATFHDHGGFDGWLYLDDIIRKSSFFLVRGGYLVLMIFDFLGIHERTSKSIPCLQERLEINGFRILDEYSYYKKVRKNGQTYRAIQQIKKIYPLATFYNFNNERISISENIEEAFVYLPCIISKKK